MSYWIKSVYDGFVGRVLGGVLVQEVLLMRVAQLVIT